MVREERGGGDRQGSGIKTEQKNKNKTMPTSRFPVLRGGGRPVPLGLNLRFRV